jgi:multisubunit Na+/H+ antiporter MnhF subunit
VISFALAAIALLAGIIPCGIVLCRGTLMEAVVAYQAISSIILIVLALLAQAFQRPSEFEFPVLLAVLMLGGGLVFVHALERWL